MNRSSNGAALILAILATTILTVLAVGLVEVVRVEIIASRAAFDRLQARNLAKAGFNLARSVLMYEDEADIDSLEDEWALLREQEPVSLGEGWFRTGVIDACSFLNVNTINEASLARLAADPTLAEAVIAYREVNGNFQGLGDLTRIEGIDEGSLQTIAPYLTVQSYERNVSASGDKRINISTASSSDMHRLLGMTLRDSQSIIRYRRTLPDQKFTSRGQLLRVPLSRAVVREVFDKATISDEEFLPGRVNLNTAPREVLLALPGATPQFVEAVLARREEKDAQFDSCGQVLDLPGVTEQDFIAMSESICTKSASFIIEATAGLQNKSVYKTLQGTVLRQPGPIAPIIYGWRETSRPVYISLEETG